MKRKTLKNEMEKMQNLSEEEQNNMAARLTAINESIAQMTPVQQERLRKELRKNFWKILRGKVDVDVLCATGPADSAADTGEQSDS